MKHPDASELLRRAARNVERLLDTSSDTGPDAEARELVKDLEGLAGRIEEAYEVAAQNGELKRFYLAYYALARALGGPV